MRSHPAGRHFLQIPGPTNVPERILQAIGRAMIDHRGPSFQQLAFEVQDGLKTVFQTDGAVIVYPASGTGAWEAALVNTLSPGDRVLMCETGQFAALWHGVAQRLGLAPELIPGDWRSGRTAQRLPPVCERTGRTRSRPSASSTTRPRPA